MKDATGGTFNMPGPCMMCEDALAVTVARSACHRAPAKPLASVGQDPCHRPLRHLGRRLADAGRPDMACSPRLPWSWSGRFWRHRAELTVVGQGPREVTAALREGGDRPDLD